MKKVYVVVGLVALALLASCTKAEEKVTINIVEGTAMEDKMMKDEDLESRIEDMMKDEDLDSKIEDMMEKEEMMKDEVMDDTPMVWSYVDYDASLVWKTDKTVLFFHADWCPTCVRLEKDIMSGEIPADLTILNVNFDTYTDLKKKYGVTSQTTLVQVDSAGNELKKWLGWDLESIVEMAQ